jgi:hypothetical protein
MGLPGPELKQRRAFEDELPCVRRLCDTVEQAFEAEPRQDKLKLLAAFAGEVHQSLPDRSGQVAWLLAFHVVASR